MKSIVQPLKLYWLPQQLHGATMQLFYGWFGWQLSLLASLGNLVHTNLLRPQT
jgi:integral membrane sensor domain MASE1